jgi:hypothetical protein
MAWIDLALDINGEIYNEACSCLEYGGIVVRLCFGVGAYEMSVTFLLFLSSKIFLSLRCPILKIYLVGVSCVVFLDCFTL